MLSFNYIFQYFMIMVSVISSVSTSPTPALVLDRILVDLNRRADPVFPSTPPSCGICQQNYASINSCAQAAPVLANVSMVIFNPGAFVDVIKCACADTFQATFPQCVDCFIQTGQEDVLNTPDLPGLVKNVRQICGLESTLLGNVSDTNSAPTPAPSTSSGAQLGVRAHFLLLALSFGLIGIAFTA